LLALILTASAACGSRQQAGAEHEEEPLARTEFTERVENFFEFAPLRAGQTSQFLIHLTDLSDGAPVAQAEVTLVARARGGAEAMRTRARVGRVTGIYVADVSLPSAGEYDIEFHIRNDRLDERMPLADFRVE